MADLHLSFASEKPMDVFGERWRNHAERIAENWRACVSERDLVVVPGDLSWAMRLAEALPDLAFLDSLPGRKILMKGNHEFWWVSAEKLRRMKEEYGFSTLFFLQGNAFYLADEDLLLCGTRGWKCPGQEETFDAGDEKIYRREQLRLARSVAFGRALRERFLAPEPDAPAEPEAVPGVFFLSGEGTPEERAAARERAAGGNGNGSGRILLFLHYPPFNNRREPSGFTERIEQEGISSCFFGHLHGMGNARRGEDGALLPFYRQKQVSYYLTSSDFLGFCPAEIRLDAAGAAAE